MDAMASSAGDWARVLILADALLEGGRFRDPVRV